MLSGLTVLVTRPGLAGEKLCRDIEACGGYAIHFPAIAFASPQDINAYQLAVDKLGEQAWLIFVSPQAVKACVPDLRRRWPLLPPDVKFAAVGSGTAAALHEAGYQVAITPEKEWNSEGLLALPVFQSVQKINIAIIRGEGGRELIDKILMERGANVLPVIAYRRILPQVDVTACLEEINKRPLNAMVCTSGEAVQHVKQLVGESGWQLIKDVMMIVMSQRVKQLAQASGFQRIGVTQTASNDAIVEFLAKNKESLMITNAVNQEGQTKYDYSVWRRVGLAIIITAMAVAVGAFGYGYYKISKTNMALANTLETVEQHAIEVQQSVDALHQTVSTLGEEVSKSQKSDGDKWRLVEAEYLVKMANTQLQFTHDIAMALSLLQRADETLKMAQDSRVLEIDKSIIANIAALQTAPQVDITSLYMRINALNEQLDHLSLPADSFKATTPQAEPVDIPVGTPWWKAGLLRSWQMLHKFVIVRNIETSGMPLVFPEEKTFLYQNLHAQLQTAMWAVLYRNSDVYQRSLTNASTWIQQYFVQDASETKTILQNLEELRKIDVKPTIANLDTTLQLFNAIIVQTAQPQADTQEAH